MSVTDENRPGSIWRGQGGKQGEPRQAVEATHREWCAGTSCPWSPAGAYGPGSPSETAGWGSDASRYSTPYLEEEKETSGSIQQLNHVGGHLHSFTTHPHWWFDFEAIKKGIQKFEFLTSYAALLRRTTKHAYKPQIGPGWHIEAVETDASIAKKKKSS